MFLSQTGRQQWRATAWRGSLNFQQCGPNQPDRRTQTVQCCGVLRAVTSDVDVEEAYPGSQRQERQQRWRCHSPPRQGDCRWTRLRNAPAGASEPAGTRIEKISQTRMERSLSTWRPHSASRWCSQLKKTADGKFVPKGPTGPTEPAATAYRVSSARPQNQDSAMCCHGWTGQNFDRSDGSATTSHNTFLCCFFRWHLGSEECGETQHQKTQTESWRTGTKKQKVQATRGVVVIEEIRKSWKFAPRNSVGLSHLSPGTVQRTTMKFWVSFGSGRQVQNSGVIRGPKRTTALAHLVGRRTNLPPAAVGTAAWKEQEYTRWPEEGRHQPCGTRRVVGQANKRMNSPWHESHHGVHRHASTRSVSVQAKRQCKET